MAYSLTGLTLKGRLKNNLTDWAYVSSDTLATIIGGGYFNDAAALMRVGDQITAVGNGAVTLFNVTINTGSAVTIAQISTAAGAEPSDGDKGDVVVSGSGMAWTLETVSIAKGGTGQVTAYAGLDALTVKGADIASASTTDIGAATGQYIIITGTTTITALGAASTGAERILRFADALTLTHNATSLILPGSADIVTATGDVARFLNVGTGNWRCIGYMRSLGLATQAKSAVAITGGSITGITDLAVADGGTGASTASVARTNLGVPYATAAQVRAETANVVVTADVLTPMECIAVSLSDLTSNLVVGATKAYLRMPYAFKLSAVRASCVNAPTGANLIFDIQESGVSILSTLLSIDATEKTSTTAATPAVISDPDLADNAEVKFDITQVGSTITGTGAIVYLIGNRV